MFRALRYRFSVIFGQAHNTSRLKWEVRLPCSGTVESSCTDFIENEEGFVVVYTDGACLNNGRDGAKAGIGIWFNHKHPLNISAAAKGTATCNNAEIQAVRVAVTQAYKANVRKLVVQTDSQFTINCMTQWIYKWKKNNWQLTAGGQVKNKEELKKLDSVIKKMECVKWNHVASHKGMIGNEMADALARKGAELYREPRRNRATVQKDSTLVNTN